MTSIVEGPRSTPQTRPFQAKTRLFLGFQVYNNQIELEACKSKTFCLKWQALHHYRHVQMLK